MTEIRTTPGPAAAYAFRLGIVTSAVVGLATIGLLYWVGLITSVLAGYALVLLFPVYLVIAATLLSSWLGYNKGPSSLHPVYRQKNSK